jgi:hypothetical protein
MAHMPTSRRLSSPFRPALRLALITAALALAPASPVHAGWFSSDPTYAGYRIPEHRWSYWTASLGLGGGHFDAPVSPELVDRRGSFAGNVGTLAAWAYDSDRLQHDWNLSLDGSGSRSRRRIADEDPLTYEVQNTDRSRSQRFALGGSVRTYPWAVPIGFRTATSHLLELRQFSNSSEFVNQGSFQPGVSFRNENRSEESQGTRYYSGSVSGWVGVGRVRDATPVHRAQVLEDRLLRKGALARPLSDDARRKLAALHAVESDIGAAHQRPGKYFWRELERILREDGALALEGLEAWDVLRLLEPLSVGSSVLRRTGFFIGPMVTVQTVRSRFTREQSSAFIQYIADTVYATGGNASSDVANDRRDDVSTSFVAEIHRPLGPRWQFDAYSNVSVREAGEFPFLSNSLSLQYILSDRWLGIVRAAHSALAEGRARRFDRWNVELAGELVYFLEDAWALRLTGSEQQAHERQRGLRRSGSFQLGVTWIVSGFFDAPGVVGPMRPAPPSP